MVDDLCDGDINIVLMGFIPAAQAHERCKAKPILGSLASNGKPFFRGVVLTNDRSIKSIKDLKGKKKQPFLNLLQSHIL